MKREKLIKYLIDSGCLPVREGSKHSIFTNPAIGKKTTIPRHSEMRDILANKICKDLGIPKMTSRK